ncbi:ATPase inhibitor subunit zeta [Azospirillum sp. INR13]
MRDKLCADLHARGVDISDHRVEKQMAQFLDVARQQVTQA